MQSVIRDELSQLIAREVKDPRVGNVTITGVDVTPDGGLATISITVLGKASDSKAARDTIEGLNRAKGFMRRHLATILTVRQAPELAFRIDRGLENALRVHELLGQISSGTVTAETGNTDDTGSSESAQ